MKKNRYKKSNEKNKDQNLKKKMNLDSKGKNKKKI